MFAPSPAAGRASGRPTVGTYIIDTDGIVRYEQVADHPGDRTYGNYVRYYIRGGFADPFDGA